MDGLRQLNGKAAVEYFFRLFTFERLDHKIKYNAWR